MIVFTLTRTPNNHNKLKGPDMPDKSTIPDHPENLITPRTHKTPTLSNYTPKTPKTLDNP